MLELDAYDPIFLARARAAAPGRWRNHHRLVRHAHTAATSTLADIDGELSVLTARRLRVLDELAHHRRRLWPAWHRRHVRRPSAVDAPAFPPAPVDAVPVGGAELRQLGVALLRRQGTMTLRDLHALIHRHGYVITGSRPVQRLGDAMAYEVAQGRLVRVGRGRYSAADVPAADTELPVPLAWAPPPGPTSVDPSLRTDPERWSGHDWPAHRQLGADHVAGAPDVPGSTGFEELVDQVHHIRTRVAALITEQASAGARADAHARHRARHAAEPNAPEDDLTDQALDPDDPTEPPHHRHRPPPPHPPHRLGDDSSANRRLVGEMGASGGSAPLARSEVGWSHDDGGGGEARPEAPP